jgi:glyoxylase-like metal-dependent hydrolase (beta-lactamase superfamily II)
MYHPNAKGLKDEVIIVPVISYLIHHKAYGYYLINTGLDISYQKDQYGRSKGIFVKNFKYKAFQMRGKSVSEILNKRHIKIEGIFLSSMNFDNISGLIDLPKYIKVYSGKKEVYKNYRFIFQTDELSGIKKIIEIDFNNSNIKETSILGRCYNFFGDGSLWLINTKGFSNGHMSFLINSINNPVLITADACFIKTGFDKIIGPGKISSDINEAQKSLNKLVEFKKKYPKVRVLFSHDLVSK